MNRDSVAPDAGQDTASEAIALRQGLVVTETPALMPSRGGAELAAGCDISPLAATVGTYLAQQKVEEMLHALTPGIRGAGLYGRAGTDGMSLVRVSFGANLPLYLHSHPGWGDCLYFVCRGEIRLWHRPLSAGSAFFVPAGQAYRYTAGPQGADVLEFRAGGVVPDRPEMKIEERSLTAVQSIIDTAKAHQAQWKSSDPSKP